MESFKDAKFALLIDADNISSKYVDAIVEETTKYGTCTYRRIYGDWGKPHLRAWKEVSLSHALVAVQQYSYTSAKNATDTAMTIDAMDMLHTAELHGFILVSSDSDFTPLAMRLREGGKIIIGIGEEKTPTPFKAACNQFIHLENIMGRVDDEKDSTPKEATPVAKKPTVDRKTLTLLKATITDLADDDTGWVSLASAGNTILKKKPDFDPRTYG
ncbi:MAG TPA: NYN domain-containing protein, partial [Flavipsychrobacter sp.]